MLRVILWLKGFHKADETGHQYLGIDEKILEQEIFASKINRTVVIIQETVLYIKKKQYKMDDHRRSCQKDIEPSRPEPGSPIAFEENKPAVGHEGGRPEIDNLQDHEYRDWPEPRLVSIEPDHVGKGEQHRAKKRLPEQTLIT